jgi:CelD/BcsL family acetyltransferase involved in cellulose biosynthesis
MPLATATPPTATSVGVIDDIAGLEALAPEWDALAAQAPLPTARHAWAAAAATAFGDGRELHVVVVRRRGRLVAVAPLIGGAEHADPLTPLGVDELDEPTDLLHADGPALGALADALARERLCVTLSRLPTDAPTQIAMREAYRLRGVVTVTGGRGCPTLDLAGAELPSSRMGARLRADVRRAGRRAERRGTVAAEMLEAAPGEVEALMAEALCVEARSWKGREGSALLHDVARAAFFRDWAHRAAADGTLRLCFLRIDGEPVAMQIAAEHARALWLLKIGYDEAYAHCSPGMLLMKEAVDMAARRGLTAYEMLGGEERWIARWTTATRRTVTLRAYPARPAGMMRLGADLSGKARARLGRQ